MQPAVIQPASSPESIAKPTTAFSNAGYGKDTFFNLLHCQAKDNANPPETAPSMKSGRRQGDEKKSQPDGEVQTVTTAALLVPIPTHWTPEALPPISIRPQASESAQSASSVEQASPTPGNGLFVNSTLELQQISDLHQGELIQHAAPIAEPSTLANAPQSTRSTAQVPGVVQYSVAGEDALNTSPAPLLSATPPDPQVNDTSEYSVVPAEQPIVESPRVDNELNSAARLASLNSTWTQLPMPPPPGATSNFASGQNSEVTSVAPVQQAPAAAELMPSARKNVIGQASAPVPTQDSGQTIFSQTLHLGSSSKPNGERMQSAATTQLPAKQNSTDAPRTALSTLASDGEKQAPVHPELQCPTSQPQAATQTWSVAQPAGLPPAPVPDSSASPFAHASDSQHPFQAARETLEAPSKVLATANTGLSGDDPKPKSDPSPNSFAPSVAPSSIAAQPNPSAQLSRAVSENDSIAAHSRENAVPENLSTRVVLARMVNAMGGSEMHIGLRTQAFGAVDVHTALRDAQLGLSISNERGDLRGFLAAELPGIQTVMRQHDLQFNNVDFKAQTTLGSHLSGNTDSQSRSSRPSASNSKADIPSGAANVEEETQDPRIQVHGRLSVHA